MYDLKNDSSLCNCVFSGKTPAIPFWDLVVLSAADEDQRTAFQMQLDEKIKRGHLPLGVEYLTFADPGTAKIGKNDDWTTPFKILTPSVEDFHRGIVNFQMHLSSV